MARPCSAGDVPRIPPVKAEHRSASLARAPSAQAASLATRLHRGNLGSRPQLASPLRARSTVSPKTPCRPLRTLNGRRAMRGMGANRRPDEPKAAVAHRRRIFFSRPRPRPGAARELSRATARCCSRILLVPPAPPDRENLRDALDEAGGLGGPQRRADGLRDLEDDGCKEGWAFCKRTLSPLLDRAI